MKTLAPIARAALAALLSTSCGQATDRSGAGPVDDGGGTFVVPEGGVHPQAQCAEENKGVYVIAEDRTFYAFDPPNLKFTNKGKLDCPAFGATPTSMAVDRFGVAWVRYSDATLWRVSTKDLTCERTAYVAPTGAFSKFGMGFATETKGGSSEVLYLSDSGGAGLAKLDTTTLQMHQLGPFTGSLAGSKCELTGTGDGKLYGFFVTSPAQVAEISKDTGTVVDTTILAGVFGGNAWAFSFYGGDFYVYTTSESNSAVTRYRPSDKSVTVVLPDVGFKIVGAGVSTCAPTTTPR